MRDLDTVINQMIAEAPPDHSLVQRLKKHQKDLLYTAPEMASYQWRRVADSLEEIIGCDPVGWQLRVANIFMNKV